MGKQANLMSFFKKVDASSPPPLPPEKPIPKYRLGFTRVLKRVSYGIEANENDDDDGTLAYQPPQFVQGKLIEYHPKATSSTSEDMYTVEWDGPPQDMPMNSNDSSPESARSRHVTTTEQWTESQVLKGQELSHTIGTKIAKKFDVDGQTQVYVGHVADIIVLTSEDDDVDDESSGTWYRILYDDGDSEDFGERELLEGKSLYTKTQKNKKKQKNKYKPAAATRKTAPPAKAAASSSSKKRSSSSSSSRETNKENDANEGGNTKPKRSRISYKEDSDSEDDALMDTDEEFDAEKAAIDESMDDDILVVDEDIDGDSEEEEEDDFKPAATKKTSKSSAAKLKRAATNKRKNGKQASDEPNSLKKIWKVYHDKLEGELVSVKPKNNPQKWPKDGEFVDPVGVDPTHGIVEGIVSEQVRKVGKLLQLVETSNDGSNKPGELSFPIQLQTACSGTDAPSIALGLIQESFNKMCPKNNFEYEHLMSCEIEPFKQGYIARNFPNVTLFPDITKLSATDAEGNPERVIDVYGRLQDIPPGNLFIAGTSCKDFSMLKTSYRKDIEDKGQSGETFLAAVEFLDLYRPPFAIFENVDGAPWIKMQEYIRGRIDLKNRNENKTITAQKSKARKNNADDDLLFVVNEDSRYEAQKIPPQVGMKAGDVVEGVVKEGHKTNAVTPILPDGLPSGKKLTLRELAKTHKINLDGDTLVLKKNAHYCTRLVKLDTKEYGLPQTRNRKYLFIWLSDDPDDNLGEYFQEILDHLKTPLLHSLEAFLLPDTHDRIRCFREALRSGTGLMVKRERAKELDFWDWPLSQVKDLTLHKAFRQVNGIPDQMRWLTGWSTRGRKSLAPGLWPELFDCWNHRRLDMIDCFACAAIRDAISRDPLHHSFIWDISQNVTRAPYRSANVGVSGCVTPGGELFVPHLGRTLMGYEKLLLQGIPFSRLALGPETEVQLSDLAGNAMSVSVVSATILAALCAPQFRKQRELSRKVTLSDFGISLKHDSAKGAVLSERGDLYNSPPCSNVNDLQDVLRELADDMADEAFRSSVLCTCESSGTVTKATKVLECSCCGLKVCHICSDRYQLFGHDLKELNLKVEKVGRPDPHVFEQKIRCAAPSILKLGASSENILTYGSGLESYSFQLQQVDRKKGHWQLIYGAWEDYGSGRQVAEIRINLGRIGILDSYFGASAFIRCFAPSIRHQKPHRGTLPDAARLIYKVGCTANKSWEKLEKDTECVLELVGSDPVESQRAIIGLSDEAARDLKSHRVSRQFVPPIQSRNPLTHYDKNWKNWPGTIHVSKDPTGRVNGTYRKMDCRHTIVLSALYKRLEGEGPMFLYFEPNKVRAKLDVAMFSPTPSYADGLEVCKLEDWIPENCLNEKKQMTTARILNWKEATNLKVHVPEPTMIVARQHSSFHEKLSSLNQEDSSSPTLCELTNVPKEVIDSFLLNTKIDQVFNFMQIDLTGKLGTRNAKRLSIIASPSLLKHAAEGKLPLKFSKWYPLPKIQKLGCCKLNVPPRPIETWIKNGNDFERIYDPEESNEYFHRLLRRPTAFEVLAEREARKLVVRMNPYVAAHRAAATLTGENTDGVEVDFRLAELSSMGEPETKEFHVPNSDSYVEAPFAANELNLPLYTRQAKALTRMMDIENGQVIFSEEERSEHILPGVGWCLIARASKKSPLRGGVLGDAIGSGKTVVTIALILKGVEKARASRDVRKGRSGATLIVVPPGLVRQWDDERKKFTGDRLKCIIIDCTDTLKKYSVEDICMADIVIVPAGIIEENKGKMRPYTELLQRKARSASIPPAPSKTGQQEAPTIEGTVVRNMASGPDIYVGNKCSQKDRDQLAYYGHMYTEAIGKLRKQNFDAKDRGIPLEYFTWERVVVDECHETLVNRRGFKVENFEEKARRGAREFLGVAQTDIRKRPLVAARGVWGLTGTPLLETEARVTELANLMGGTYLLGAAHHWRKEERESSRDMFLDQIEGVRSREYRCAVQEAAHRYVHEACQRNRGEKLHVALHREQYCVHMSEEDGKKFLSVVAMVELNNFSVSADHLGEKTTETLSITASSQARHQALNDILDNIQKQEPNTKIIIFATNNGYNSAMNALKKFNKTFCHISDEDSVQKQNEVLSWFRHVDATEEEKKRPRVLLLSMSQAAGHNMQSACHNVILYDPVYTGSDAVADASVEEQAVGRVMRQGQQNDVTVTRIIVKGPEGQDCVDDWIVQRNLDEDVLRAATSNFD